MFEQSQIEEFKEAFNVIDHDRVYVELSLYFCFIGIDLGWSDQCGRFEGYVCFVGQSDQ